MEVGVQLPDNYIPSEDEPFMNFQQREYFRRRLLNWREQIVQETKAAVNGMQHENLTLSDFADHATEEANRTMQLRMGERKQKLVNKINTALERIDMGEFGYCQETGRAISLSRLIARPIATLCLEAQLRHERSEKVQFGD